MIFQICIIYINKPRSALQDESYETKNVGTLQYYVPGVGCKVKIYMEFLR